MFNSSEILAELEKTKKVNISFHYHSESLLKSIDAFFSKLLAKIDMIYLLDSIVTILREIIANAIKANAKRYYFKKIIEELDVSIEKYMEFIERKQLTEAIEELIKILKGTISKTRENLKMAAFVNPGKNFDSEHQKLDVMEKKLSELEGNPVIHVKSPTTAQTEEKKLLISKLNQIRKELQEIIRAQQG